MSSSINDVGQSHLVKILRQIFPDESLLLNSRRLGGVEYPPTSSYLELDCWLPKLHLAFEFQDPHHYVSTWYSNVSQHNYIVRDGFKQQQMIGRGETLLEIPCWWNGSKESLIATIKNARNDLLAEYNSSEAPIPVNPPENYFNRFSVPRVGELMLASFCSSPQFDPTLWWMSEKYDGMRVCWDPLHKKLYSRSNREIQHIAPFVQQPNVFTDGEIWFGRGNFVETSKIALINKGVDDPEGPNPTWDVMRYVAFDCPITRSTVRTRSAHCEYETRYAELIDVKLDHPIIIVAAIVSCINRSHMNDFMKNVLEASGEGLILREPKSAYHPGRSDCLLKIKALRDMEGLVMDHSPPEYTLLLPNGLTIQAGYSQNAKELDNIQKGAVVSFSYVTFDSEGLPTSPKIFRHRPDLRWRDLLAEDRKSFNLTQVSEKMVAPPQPHQTPRHPRGHWTRESEIEGEKGRERDNVRSLLDSFARGRNMDPLVPENWYSISRDEFCSTEYAKSVLQHYNNSFIRCVMEVYPNIGLEDHKFIRMRKNYWNEPENRKKFFDRFAEAQGFHPVKHYKQWYNVDAMQLCKHSAGKMIICMFGSFVAALRHVYPNIPFKDHLFARMKSRYWTDETNRREFFVRFARKRKFDPLVPDNWYAYQAKDIRKERGGSSVLQGSFITVLTKSFPDIALEPHKFLYSTGHYWRDFENRRAYFASLVRK